MTKIFDLKPVLIEKDFIQDLIKYREYNENIIKYYRTYAWEKNSVKYKNNAFNISNCNKLWYLDHYKKHDFKDFQKTSLCKDRFCANCKKVRQSIKMNRYLPLMEVHDENLYFITLTQPNCHGDNLKYNIKHIFKCFDTLLRYIDGRKKIKGIDFTSWGYKGAIKSLEVSFKSEGRFRFHPHIHCAFVLEDFKQSKKYISNRYSKDNTGRREDRLYTNEEVLLQKIWWLLFNNYKVTKSNLSLVETSSGKLIRNVGYSVTIDKFKPLQYAEMFKYMVKDKDSDGNIMDYRTFKVLLEQLKGVKQITGHGIFYNVKDDDDDFKEFCEEIYKSIVFELKKNDKPVKILEDLNQVYHSDSIYISRKKVYTYLKLKNYDDLRKNIDYTVDNKQLLNQKEIIYYEELSKSIIDDLKLYDKVQSVLKRNLQLDYTIMDTIIKHVIPLVNIDTSIDDILTISNSYLIELLNN